MKTPNWAKELPVSIVVCDRKGTILFMNERACETFAAEGGAGLVKSNVLDCHPLKARKKLKGMLRSKRLNVYTIEKKGVRKMVYQSPWYEKGRYRGFAEIVLPLPNRIPHFVRKA